MAEPYLASGVHMTPSFCWLLCTAELKVIGGAQGHPRNTRSSVEPVRLTALNVTVVSRVPRVAQWPWGVIAALMHQSDDQICVLFHWPPPSLSLPLFVTASLSFSLSRTHKWCISFTSLTSLLHQWVKQYIRLHYLCIVLLELGYNLHLLRDFFICIKRENTESGVVVVLPSSQQWR